ncbi:protein-disulfide reductase DsbD domain-containing protein [Singulisphaera sp. Ch08]|uniref:Protein-disulfide reductase DsbD domain-containing protein n=1 Tax=Singulisphaera sp. Ch08 TaxID=3120278 RepID=A0AAU7CPF1_9BACT
MCNRYLHVPWILASLIGPFSGCDLASTPPRAKQPHIKLIVSDRTQPIALANIPASEPTPHVPEPSPSEPVKAVLALRPANISPGTKAELLVTVRIAKAHYLHPEADHGGTFTPLKMNAMLPAGVEFVGDWNFPPPEEGRAGVPIYRNSVQIRRAVKVTSLSPETLNVTGVLHYQACNDELCWPPGKLELSTQLTIQAEASQ